MSNLEHIQKNLLAKKIIYLYDSFEGVVCKIIPSGKDSTVFLKFKGKKEFETDPKSNLVFDIEQGGNIITEKEYNGF